MRAEARPPSLSVVIPATDSPPTLDACLGSLRGCAYRPLEVVVQRDPVGAGPAEARNRGAGAARGEILVFVDSDVLVHADALGRIAAQFERDPGLAALFGAYDQDPPAPGVVSRFRNLLHHQVHASAAGPAETFWAGLGAVRRTSFEAIGGFDSCSFPRPSIEDIELGMRLRARGERILLDPKVRGTHLKAWTLRGMVATDFARRGVPWARLVLERRAGARALNLGWRHRGSAALSVAAAIALSGRRLRAAGAAGAGLVALNAPFYSLLARRGGPGLAMAGVGLHAVHHLTAVAAFAAAAVIHTIEGSQE